MTASHLATNKRNRKRILIVASWYPDPEHAARGVFIERDSQLLANLFDVEVVHLIDEKTESSSSITTYNGLKVHIKPLSRSNPIQIIRVARELSRQIQDFDAVHSMAFTALLPLFAARKWFGFRKPWIHTEHLSALLPSRNGNQQTSKAMQLLKHTLAGPDTLIAVSETLADAIKPFRKKGPIKVIPNLVPSPVQVSPRRKVEDAPRLLFIGHLIDRKDPLLAIKTIKVLLERGLNPQLTIVGKGPLEDSVHKLIADLDLTRHVHLIGEVPPVEIPDIISAHDFIFIPTKNETFFLACAEGLAAGRPVIVGANGAHAEYVREPYGFLVTEQSEDSYADAIQQAILENVTTSAQEISESITEKFGPKIISTLIQETYDEYLK